MWGVVGAVLAGVLLLLLVLFVVVVWRCRRSHQKGESFLQQQIKYAQNCVVSVSYKPSNPEVSSLAPSPSLLVSEESPCSPFCYLVVIYYNIFTISYKQCFN